MRIRLASGESADARIKGKRIKPVCGDKVHVEPIAEEDDWLITKIDERHNALARPNMRGKVEVLAANLDAVVVVAAPSPMPDWFIVDRYLCAAELMQALPIVVFNKTDLIKGLDIEIPELDEYREVGIDVFECSADDGEGLQQLADALQEKTAIIVGQSGVGKSSIMNRLASDPGQRTASISAKSGEGRHTTVNSVLIPLKNGGEVIDSPGVRDYAPALEGPEFAAVGFREISEAAQDCRFANCRHLREPGCAVKKAVEDEQISYRRYESFKRLVNITEQIAGKRN